MPGDRRAHAVALASLLILLGGLSCGGEREANEVGGATGTTTTATTGSGPDRSTYIAKADALCARGAANPEVVESLQNVREMEESDPEFRSTLTAHFELVLEVAESFAAEFKALEAPAADRARITEFNAANDEAIAALRAVISALEGTEDPSDELEAYGRALAVAERLGAAYGFEVCAQASPD